MRLYIFSTEDEIGDKEIEAATYEEALARYLRKRGLRPGHPVTVFNDRGESRTINA